MLSLVYPIIIQLVTSQNVNTQNVIIPQTINSKNIMS